MDWPWSTSATVIWPDTDSVVDAAFSVTSCSTGSPITAASFAPWIVNEMTFGVPSKAVTVKVSTWVSVAPSDWVAELATE